MASTQAHAQAHHTRRLARTFTPLTPKHHPLLDPNLPAEDVALVPQDLRPRGQLNWELPKKARTNVHIMLNLSNKADELLEEFHEKLPLIDEVLNEWAEMRGASPTIKGLEKLRAQSSSQLGPAQTEESGDCIFNMVKNLETPGRSDVIYLTDAAATADPGANFADDILAVREVVWLDDEDAFQEGPPSAIPEALSISKVETTDDDPSSSRTVERETSQEILLTPKIYSPSKSPTGPFEDFWRHHEAPFGSQVVLGGEDNDSMSPCSLQQCVLDAGSPYFQKQNPSHLMIPA